MRQSIVCLSLAGLLACPGAWAGVECPPSPMGKLACEAVQQVNQPARLKAWLASATSSQTPARDRDELLATLESIASQSGGVDLVAARAGRIPGVAVVTVQARRKSARLMMVLHPDPAQPDKLARLDTVPLPDPVLYADWPTQALPDTAIAAAVKAQLRRLVSTRDFSGCVQVANASGTFFAECSGLAERSFKNPTTPGTKFHIGSMDKMFTAVAIAQLVEAGKLSYDSTLSNLIPQFPAQSPAGKATVEQMLRHMAGLGDFFVPEFFEHRERYVAPADYVELIARQPTRSEPGERWSYSNAGYVLLGRIVELKSGEDYFAYLQRHVFSPAGMTATGFDAIDEVTPGLAVGYLRDDPFAIGPWKANWMTLPFKGSPAGGGYSTAADLLRFSRALRGGKLLGKAALASLFRDEVAVNPEHGYAAGFDIRRVAGKQIRGHNGGAPGMNAALGIVWESGYAVAVTSNEDGPSAQELADHIADLLARAPTR